MFPTVHRPATADAPNAANSALPLPCTPGLLLGPYYPVGASGSSVLWAGASLPGGVQALVLHGHVRSRLGEPVEGAEVELWHADPNGRYRHPCAPAGEQTLDGFAGHGRTLSDGQGAFVFHSLVPGGYVDGETRRAPHLHLQITGRIDRLVTQLFLPGQATSMQDRWYSMLRHPDRLTPESLPSPDGALHLRWTAVLNRG